MHKTEIDNRLDSTWWALRLLFGVVPVVAGLDKYFNLLTDWTEYLNPLATKLLPISATTFMHIVGVVEIAAGLIVLSRWTRLGSYVVTLWLVAIALNLLVMGKFLDVAVRDLGLAVAAFTLSQLTAVREEASMASRTSSSRSQCARSSAFSALAAEAAAFAVTSFQWPNPCRVLRDRAGLLNSCENETLTRTAALP